MEDFETKRNIVEIEISLVNYDEVLNKLKEINKEANKFSVDETIFANTISEVCIEKLEKDYTKKELEQKIVNDLYKKEIYSKDDIELIKAVLK